MRFAEVFLRLGCSLVGWMVLFTYAVWLAALHEIGCGPDGDELHLLLLWMAPVTVLMALMTRLTGPFDEIHRILSWLGVPTLILLLLAIRSIRPSLAAATLGGDAICGDGPAATWHVLWAPAQIGASLAIAVILVLVWRSARRRP